MGPKGERGHPGSIVWNGIKVNLVNMFIFTYTKNYCDFDRAKKVNQVKLLTVLSKCYYRRLKVNLFKVHRDHQDKREKSEHLVLMVLAKLDHLAKM